MPTDRRFRLPATGILFLTAAAAAASAAEPRLVFNTTGPTNDLQGTLAAQVLFAQSQVIPARPREGDHQPHLIGRRRCLLLVRPLEPDGAAVHAAAFDKAGRKLGELRLDPPEKLPRTAYFLDGLPDEAVEFEPAAGPVAIVESKADLDRLTDPAAAMLLERLRMSGLVEIRTADGLWVRDIHLPRNADLEGKMVRVRSTAGYSSTIHYGDRSAGISRNQTLQFKSVRGQWVLDGELENQGLAYATDAWSGVLPAEWIMPGLKLAIRRGKLAGDLDGIEIGPPTELLLHTIDLGMLV
ncbi:MAG: M66 family metalloprotease, partial [Planctomycetia bacterium]